VILDKGFWKHRKWGHPRPLGPWAHHHRFRPEWRRRRRLLFARLAAVFGFIFLLVLAGMAVLAALLARVSQTGRHTAGLLWIMGCGLALALPLLAAALAARTFRGVTTPLADVMAAADTVAAGDLTVRVETGAHGEFGRLARSFNRMTEELERADRQRRNLTADVAHELRTPLHLIQGNLEGILDGVYEPTAEHISATLDETRLLSRLVDDLRTLSLAEAGQLPLMMEPLEVAELLADVSTSFGGQADAAGIRLRTRVAEGLPTITGDIGRLDQVLGNLVANALRHTGSGGTITLSAEPEGGQVCIMVRDTGEGIPAEDLPFIFDRFWRGDRSRSRADGAGSGLGLVIARYLVQAHGGRIDVESQPGQGTTFAVRLPIGGDTS
jgi:two-component system sensor histidine kinase BaeS